MMISEKHKFIALLVQRTGTTSISKILYEKFEAKLMGNDGRIINIHPEDYHKDPKHAIRHQTRIPLKYRDYFTFATIRNPFYREISWYIWARTYPHDHEANVLKMGLKEWLERTDTQTEQLMICGNNRQAVDRFVKVENIQQDFNSLPFVKNKETIPHINKQFRKESRKLFTPTLIKWFVNRFRLDFEIFGYDKTPPDDVVLKIFKM